MSITELTYGTTPLIFVFENFNLIYFFERLDFCRFILLAREGALDPAGFPVLGLNLIDFSFLGDSSFSTSSDGRILAISFVTCTMAWGKAR